MAVFVLYASEAFRTGHQGGSWTWATVEQPIGLRLGQFDRAEVVKRGLAWWGRQVRRTETQTQYLFSIVVEGGFPDALVHRESASVRRWLTLLLADAEKYGLDAAELEELAAQHARVYLPPSLCQNEVHHLGAELVAATRALRQQLGQIDEYADPILRLNELSPGWDDQLPVRLSDQAARELVRGLVQQRVEDQGGGTLGAFVQRVLVNDGACRWSPAVKLSLSGEVSAQRLPDAVRRMITSDVLRLRLQGSGPFGSAALGELSVGERRDETRWAFRMMRYRDEAIPLPITQAVEMTARIGTRVSDPFVVPGGERLDGDVLVFLVDEKTRELVYAGSGSVRTRAASAWVAFDKNVVSAILDEGASPSTEAMLDSDRLSLIKLTAPATFLTGDDLSVRVVPGAQNDQRRRLIVLGKSVPQLSARTQICLGWPTLLFEGGINVATSSVRWRPAAQRQPWRALDKEHPPAGAVDVAIVVSNELLASARVVVLPVHFRLERSPGGAREGLLRFYGLGDAHIRVQQDPELTIELWSNDDVQGLSVSSENVPPSYITIDIQFPWGATGPMQVPFPGNRTGFIAADGNWLDRPSVPFRPDQLAGIRASAPSRSLLFARLIAAGLNQNLVFDLPFEGLVPVAALQPDFEALFSESDDLDAHIRLEVENARIELGRYDLSFEISGASDVHLTSPSVEKLVDEGADSVDVVTADLTDFSEPPRAIATLSSANFMQPTTVPPSGSPLLLWGEVGGRPRTRPVVIPPIGDHKRSSESFVACTLVGVREKRLTAMARHLDSISADPLHPDWNQLNAGLHTYQGKLPLAILDWLVALSASPKALAAMLAGRQDRRSIEAVIDIEDELPLCWCLVPIDAWVGAFANGKEKLATSLQKHGVNEPERLAGQFAADRLVWLAEAAPRLYATALAISQKSGVILAPSANRGEQIAFSSECQSCMIRNSDRHWPSWPQLQTSSVAEALPNAAPHMLPVLAAPLIAAHHAARAIPSNAALIRAVREARRFDQTYFDRVYPLGVLKEVYGIEIPH